MIRILGFTILVLGTSLVSADPIQWPVAEGGNGHWYEAIDINDGVTRAEANSHAVSLGGYLVTLTSSQEDAWVYNNVDVTTPRYTYDRWIGAYQDTNAPDYSEPAGGWRWENGDIWSYSNWSNGLDNNDVSYPEEEFAHYCGGCGGSWNDILDVDYSGNSIRKNFLVEWDSVPAVDTGPWDLAADFSKTNNPNQAWSYGWQAEVGATFTLFDARRVDLGTNTVWYETALYPASNDHSAHLWKNETGAESGGIPDQWVSLHAGPFSGIQPAVARWTSPVAGTVTVEGVFAEHVGGPPTDVHIQHNGLTIWERLGYTTDEPFSIVLEVTEGDTLDWMASGVHTGGNTPLAASVGLMFAGDYNADGIIDAADYTVWRDNMGQTVVPGTGADGDGDGYIGLKDYLFWKNHFGNGADLTATSGTPVPEPTTLLLVLMAFLGTPLRRAVCHSG